MVDKSEEVNNMSEKEARILEIFGKAIPEMTESEKDRLLAFGEGMALMIRLNQEQRETLQGVRATV